MKKTTFALILCMMALCSCGNSADSSSVSDISSKITEESSVNSVAESETDTLSTTDNESSEISEPSVDTDEMIDEGDEVEENEAQFDSAEEFLSSAQAEYLCENNGFNPDNLIPDNADISSVYTYNTCYYLTVSVNGVSVNICVSNSKFDDLQGYIDKEKEFLEDGGFALPSETELDEEKGLIVKTYSDGEMSVIKLNEDGFDYEVYNNELSKEELIDLAQMIEF